MHKAEHAELLRFLLSLITLKLTFRELRRLDFAGFLEYGVANMLQTQDFSLLFTTPLNYQRGRQLKQVSVFLFLFRSITPTQARHKLDMLVTQLAEKEGVNKNLNAQDQLAWGRDMNNIRNRAEESSSTN